MRLFVAAELPAGLRRRFASVQEELAGMPLPVRWVRQDGMHLTLKFLGETADSRLAEVRRALAGAGRDQAAFGLHALRAGAYPDRGVPRIIWVEVGGDVEAARRLAGAIEAAAGRVGFPAENREFRPHLTLGRVKGPGRGDWRSILQEAAPRASGEFQVSEFVLFDSRLGPGGSVYTPIERYSLGGPGPGGGAP